MAVPVNTLAKREEEKAVMAYMVRYYCDKKHSSKHFCQNCQELLDYATARINNCPFMETKTFCSNCNVHCYKKDMREQIRVVMRFSGPRMMFHKPIMTIRHIYYQRKEQI